MWLITTVIFVLLRILPGDALENQLLQSGASPATIEARRIEQGLNEPVWIQYTHYILNLVQGNLGQSLLSGLPVNEIIASRLLPTATLAITAIIIAATTGIGLGLFMAIQPSHFLFRLSSAFATLTLAIPIAWSGTLALILFAGILKLFSLTRDEGFNQSLLPAAVLGLHSAGAIAFVVRANIQEILTADFVRTAYAKGLPKKVVLQRHVLRAALPPIITVVFVYFGFLLGGTVITESLFVRPGLGRLLLDSTLQHDYPVVQGIAILAVTIYTLLNWVADFIVRLVDPRITLI